MVMSPIMVRVVPAAVLMVPVLPCTVMLFETESPEVAVMLKVESVIVSSPVIVEVAVVEIVKVLEVKSTSPPPAVETNPVMVTLESVMVKASTVKSRVPKGVSDPATMPPPSTVKSKFGWVDDFL